MSVQWLIVNQSLQQTFDLMMTGVESRAHQSFYNSCRGGHECCMNVIFQSRPQQ